MATYLIVKFIYGPSNSKFTGKNPQNKLWITAVVLFAGHLRIWYWSFSGFILALDFIVDSAKHSSRRVALNSITNTSRKILPTLVLYSLQLSLLLGTRVWFRAARELLELGVIDSRWSNCYLLLSLSTDEKIL